MEYYSVNQYLRDTFGRKIYKIALDGGFTCPNRDGRCGTRGCIFCSGSGSGDFAANRNKSVTEQIEEGRKLVEHKLGWKSAEKEKSDIVVTADAQVAMSQSRQQVTSGAQYLAYFQAFTNTYAPTERLEQLYTEALNHPDIAAISIATRPDCLPDDVIELLARLNKIKPVWVELGLQTIHEQTAQYIRRGYTLDVYDDAVMRLREAGIPQIITHVILGLPGETEDMMLATVRHVASVGSNGIKLQLLHVLQGTDLEQDYRDGVFEVMTMEEYTDLVVACLRELPPDMVVHRMTGDGARRSLVAPLWSTDKKRVLNTLMRKIREA